MRYLLLVLCMWGFYTAPILAQTDTPLRWSILKTGSTVAPDGLVWTGGNWWTQRPINHSAFLIARGSQYFLFESGLGDAIDKQFAQEMPWILQGLFHYRFHASVRTQLRPEHYPTRIVLSHVHWDHGGGLQDFPDVPVTLDGAEFDELLHRDNGRTFAAQFQGAGHRLKTIPWSPKPYAVFAKHWDVFGDGSAIVVPLPGHSWGSVGLLLQVSPSQRFFLVGDAVWAQEQVRAGQHKFSLASGLVDRERDRLLKSLIQIQHMQQQGYTIVPTHDARIQDRLGGYYPQWVASMD